MTEDVTKEDFENFDDKTQDEKRETLARLHNKLAESDDAQGLLQELGVEYEVTVRVLDEDGEEKQVEKEQGETILKR